MKLDSLKMNVQAREEGAWVDSIPEMEGLRLKVRGVGNKDWRKLQARLYDAIPRKKRIGSRIDPEEQERITTTLMLETGLVDWAGIEDNDDKPIPYSKEAAAKMLRDPEMERFRDAVLWACTMVSEQGAERVEEVAGN